MAENVTPIGGFSQAGAEMLREMADNTTVYAEYLKFHGRMYKQSPSVSLEFFVQRPESRFVATLAQWERLGNPVLPDSSAIRFRDSRDRIVPMYDITQCEHPERVPQQWHMSAEIEAAVRSTLRLPADREFLNGLVGRAYSSEYVTAAMQQLGVQPQNAETFKNSFLTTVATMIAGRLEVGGNSFPTVTDQSIFKIMTEEQQIGFITMAAAVTKRTLEQIEQVVADLQKQRAERMVQDEVRGISEAGGRGNAADSGRGAAGSPEGDAAQLPDAVQSDEEGRRAGLGSGAGNGERHQDIIPPVDESGTAVRGDILVSGESGERDIRDADGTRRTDDAARTDRDLRNDVDAVDGGQSSGESRSDEVSSPLSDGSAVSGQESMGIPEPAGRAVHGSESPSARLREDSGMGADEDTLHGQRDDQGHRASGSHDSVTDKIAQAFAPTEKPSADQTDGFVVLEQQSKPLTHGQQQKIERNAAEDEDFSSKIDSYINGSISSEEVFRVGTTPYSLRIVGADAIPIIIKQSVLKNSLAAGKASRVHTEGHELSPDIIKQLPSALRNPIFVLKGSKPESLAVITDLIDRDGNHLLVSLKLNAAGRRSEVNNITSVYGKKNIGDYIQRELSNGNILAVNIEKAEKLSADIGIQFPKWTDILCFDDSITYTDENVKRLSEISAQNSPTTEPEKPISKERRAEMLAAFSAKYGLDGLDVFVKKDKDYAGEGRAYDLLIKNGRTVEFQARIFTLEQGARFTEAVLESALAKLEQSAAFQQFLSFRQGQHTLFDQPEDEKVDTSSNSEPEMDAESIAIRQREIDKAIQSMQRRLESSELTLEKRQELEDNIAFLQSADAEHIEITQEAMDAFRAKRAQEREAQLDANVEREWEEAAEREVSANLEAADALDHHRDVYLDDTRDSDESGYITNARKQDFYNYRLHFDAEQGYLLMADGDREDDLIIRNFGMADSSAVLREVQAMGFEVESVEPAFTYEIYQLKSGEEHHYHRFESMESNKYAHLTQDDYDLVYSGDLRDIEGDTVQQKLNALFEKFNTDHPADFFGRSMSTSDVVVVTEGSGRTPYYVQPVGFEVMPDFFAHKYDLIDIQFTGNPQGFNAIKVAARTDSFEDTGETNMLIADTQVFYARLSENANLADVQKVIQTAYDNNCYLTADSVAYLTERFGKGFMPELPPVKTVFEIPESDQTIDLAAVESFTLTDSYSQYEGGMDSDGHERRDNYSGHSQSLTFTYRGNGIVESEMWSDKNDYPITDTYNLYSPAERDRLFADMYRFVDRAEQLTVSSEPKAEKPKPRYILMLNVPDVQLGDTFDRLEDAQDAGNEAIWDGKAIGYAILNQHEHKVEVYDGDFPTSGVFSDEVYANSPFQTLTVHTEAPLPALHDDEPAQLAETEPESTIEFGLLGNGITVYDTARTQPHSSDYLTVAHISEEGNVQYYAEVSDSNRKRIEAEAARQLAKFTEQWNALPDTEKLMRIMQTANPTQLVQIIGDRLPADQTIAKYEKSVIFHSEDFPADGQKQAAAVSEPLTVEALKNRYLNRDTNRQMDSYEIAGMVLFDSEGMKISAQEFFDRYHASNYSPTQAAEIRGYIAEALKNSPQETQNEQTAARVWTPISETENDDGEPTVYATETMNGDRYFIVANPEGTFDIEIRGSKIEDQTGYSSRRAAENGFEEYISDMLFDRAVNLINDFCVAEYNSEADFNDLSHVNLAYTTDEDTEAEIQVYADLQNFRIVTQYAGLDAAVMQFASLEDMVEHGLEDMSFDDLVHLTSEQRADVQRKMTQKADAADFRNADLAGFLADRTLSSDEWEDLAYPLYDRGYLDKHQPSDKAAFGYHLSESALYDLARRFHDGEDIRRELALGLLEGSGTSRIEFVFEEGKISGRTFYHPESERHTLETQRTADGYSCYFNGIERNVSFEEIGQAFLDHIHEEFNDLAFWWVRDDLHEAFPEMTDEQMRDLITAFDGARMADWEKGDNRPKINHIKRALYEILGDEEKTEKAFAIIAEGKYHVNLTSDAQNADQQIDKQPPQIADGKPLSNLITFVRDENRRVLDELAVGDSIGLPNGNYTVTAIDGDFKIDLRSDETGNTGSRIGNWKEMLLNEAGNAPISVVKASVVQQLADAAAAKMPETSIAPEVDTNVNPEHSAPELAVGDHLIYKGKEYEVESLDMDSFITLKDTALENAPRLVSRVTFVAQEFINSGDFQRVEPQATAEAESEKVDTNVNPENDTDKQSEPEEPARRRGRLTRPEELYKLLSEMYPQIISGEHTHEHYEADENSGYEPLSVQMIGDGMYAFTTYYYQNGDALSDPDITFLLDHDEKTCHVFSFQQDGVPPHGTYYVEVADENGRVDTKLQASLEQTFLQNLKNAQFADRTLTRYHDRLGEEIVLVPDKDEIQDVAEPEEPVRTDENAHLRGILNDFSEEHGLGALDLRFTGSREVGIFETYADGSDKQLGEQPYWGDNDQISPTECTEILQRFVETERRRGHRVEDANGRKYAVSARGKSELPPVPDSLPEIVYAKAPLQKVRDNIEAIRELHRLARCEAAGEPLYDPRRNQWHCRENSDERLRKYSGWGGLSQVFDAKSGRYAELRAELQKLLTPEEYASAKASSTDAHYTPQIVIDAMYSAIQSMGLPRDSRVLEPACGTGNFITRMPHSIGNAGVVGVELDDITAQIAMRLNADNSNVTIMHSAFERSGQEDNSFDLVIGNVPFGDYKMNDPDYTQDWLIHDAFFRKALDKVAAGGVVAFVTSTGTLDKKNPKVREYLATHADLIGAIRLPNTAFSDAGTGVSTDIIFLQKRAEPLSPDAPKPDWCYVAPISDENPDMRINSYFVQNPQMMLGTMRQTSHFDRLTCDPIEGADLKKQLAAAVKQLNAKITVTKREKAAQERRGFIQPWGKQFTYQEKEGKLYYNEGKTMRQITGSAAEIDRLKRLIELRILTRQLIDKQKTAVEDFALIPLREHLNRQYDEFVAKYGQLNSDAVKKAFGADADYALLQSLEEYDSDTKTYHKAEIFNKRTVNPVMEITAVETLEEAYQVSLDRRGKPNIPYMATLLQAQYPDTPFTELTKQVQAELLEKGMVFIDPEKEIAGEEFSGIVERAEYLSGNVRRKLAYAQEMAKNNPDFQRNVDALQEVIPDDIHAEEIAVRMGCPWIDAEDYTKFLQELSGRRSWDTRCEVKYSPVTGEFDIMQAGSRKDINVNEGTTYGTDKLTMYEIAQKLLNQRRIAVMMTVPSPKDASKTVTRTDPVETKKAMEKAKLIEEKFAEWIFADPARRAKYERRYNDLFNSLVGRKYDGSHLTFDGQSASFSLRPHQRDCVARAVYGGNTLAAHVVGAGKSAVFQTAVMKKKQLGLINKACVVVPKPLVEQTAREWRKLYPDARLLTMSAADLSSEAKRDQFAARVATGDYDAVIVSMEQFEKMPMSLEFQKAYLLRQLDELEDMLRETRNANGNRKDATTKQIEGAKKKLKARLDSIMNPKSKQKGKDILLDFEQLGFDYLVVDEAHNFKNGFVQTKMGNVSGVTTSASGRAQDMQMKCDYFNEQLGQGHLLFCTGTPVSNSMTELYVMLRYLRPDLLAAAGVERFDDWAATFGKVTTQHKQSATGELKLKTTFAKFANLPELMQMYKEFADIQSAKKLDLPRPKLKTGKPQIVTVQASPEQKDFVKMLVERARLISEGRVDPRNDNMLVITSEARLTGLCNSAVAALMRKHQLEVPEGFEDAKTSKVDACVDKVAEIYAETTEQKGVQIIFSDVAVNSDDGNFSVYDYIRKELIAKGIPADEIIYAPKSEAKNREDIFRDINAGKYRVVIASTGTLGTGANVQERLAAVHHVDVPWKPSDLEQREGRILRQGNTFSEVQIFNYITQGTMDSYLYQIVTDKARFIAQLLDDETPARVSEDCDDKVLTYGEMQAAAEGNPNFRKRIELGMKISELQFAKAEFQRETGEMRSKIATIPSEIASLRERITDIEKDIVAVDRMRNPEGKIDGLTVRTAMGKTLTKREDINQYLHSLLYQKQKNPFDDLPAFQIGDFSVTIQMNGSQQDFAFVVQGESPVAYRAAAEFNEKSDNAQRLMNLLGNGVPNEKSKCESRIEKLEADMVQAAERAEQTFPHEQELADAQAELEKVEAELLGITEMEAAILDPDEVPVEETDAERTARESFFKTDDDDDNNDLNPNTDSETLPPVAPRM